MFALNLPFRQTVRPSSITETGKREIGFEIHYPLTLGIHNIDDLPGIIEPDNFGTITFTPGLELEIPLSQHWHLRPFINVGWGNELEMNHSAWIYYSGIKSRFTFPADSNNRSRTLFSTALRSIISFLYSSTSSRYKLIMRLIVCSDNSSLFHKYFL